jgi:hypothetical protein
VAVDHAINARLATYRREKGLVIEFLGVAHPGRYFIILTVGGFV